MVQTSISTQTKVFLVSSAALATGLAAYALGYYDYDWRVWNLPPEQVQQQVVPTQPETPVIVQAPAATLTMDPRLPDGYVGREYKTMLYASTGAGTRWVLEQGTLPPGLTLDEAQGIIRGVPTAIGSSLFRLNFGKDGLNGVSQFTLNIVGDGVKPPEQPATTTAMTLGITTAQDLPSGRVGTSYQQDFGAIGGPAGARYVWEISQLPNGLTANENGAVRGTPTAAGVYLVQATVRVRDVAGLQYTNLFKLQILPKDEVIAPPATTPFAITSGFPDGTIGSYYSAGPLSLSGGQSPFEWSIASGNIPTGLSFSSSGQLSGYANQYGIFTFTVQVRDQSNRLVRAERTINIRPAQPVVSASIDPDLSNRLRRIDLIGVQVHDLIKLQDDGNPDTQFDTTVYYVGADGRRHSFPNPKVYFTWFPDFSRVRIVAPRELADIPLGANLTYRPGSRLVKFATDPRVYAVDSDRRLRWVKTEAVAQALYGPFWARQTDDVSDAFYMDYRFGADVDRSGDYSVNGAQSTAVFPSDVLPR